MPPPTYGRIRTSAVEDLLPNSNVILGRFYPGIQVGGVYTGTYSPTPNQTVVFNYHTSRRFDWARVTMDSVHEGPPYRSGGDFSALAYRWCTPYEGVHGTGTYERADKSAKYVGGFHPPSDFSPNGVIDGFSFAHKSNTILLKTVDNLNHPTMAGLGDKAWKSTKPKLQKADALVFTAELRDLPRMLKSTSKRFHEIWRAMGGHYTSQKEIGKAGIRLMQPKKVADDFLNHQFGWVPFLKDLVKFDTVVRDYHDIIARSVDRNDRWVRRRVPLEGREIVSTIRSDATNQCHPTLMNANYFMGPTNYSVSEVKQISISAVGKFRYYRPEFDVKVQDKLSQWNSAMQFITVAGFRATPSNVYRAIPWTWAIDWFANVGDYVDRLTEIFVDSIACQYCFVMNHQRTIRRAVQQLPFVSGDLTLSFEREIDSKQRIQGSSPFDFNSTWDGLTPRQLAIAAALGIARK